MKIIKYLVLSLSLVGSAYGISYTPEQQQKVIEMLNFLQLNAQCAQASAAILAAPHAVLSSKEKDAMRDQIKLFAENLVKYQAFLQDMKQTASEKIKEIAQK